MNNISIEYHPYGAGKEKRWLVLVSVIFSLPLFLMVFVMASSCPGTREIRIISSVLYGILVLVISLDVLSKGPTVLFEEDGVRFVGRKKSDFAPWKKYDFACSVRVDMNYRSHGRLGSMAFWVISSQVLSADEAYKIALIDVSWPRFKTPVNGEFVFCIPMDFDEWKPEISEFVKNKVSQFKDYTKPT